jgi:NhaP-type Na+/H+ or K+/H+ antiporter
VPPAEAKAEISHSLLDFNEQLERVAEFGIVLALGVMISTSGGSWIGVAIAVLLFVIVRPLAVWLSINRRDLPGGQYRFIGWFGIRGVGSLYYLFFAVNHAIDRTLATELIPLVLTVVACSIVAHGISATPLMRRYDGGGRTDDVRAAGLRHVRRHRHTLVPCAARDPRVNSRNSAPQDHSYPLGRRRHEKFRNEARTHCG